MYKEIYRFLLLIIKYNNICLLLLNYTRVSCVCCMCSSCLQEFVRAVSESVQRLSQQESAIHGQAKVNIIYMLL